jgi:molecular chaperone GrpE
MKHQPEKTELEKKLEADLASHEAAEPLDAKGQREEMGLEDEFSAEDAVDGADDDLPEMVPAADFQALIQERNDLTKERNDLKDQLLRARAEFDNYRKRTQRDAEQVRLRAAEALIRDLLPVIDNLELALQHADKEHPLAEGVNMVVRQFQDALRKAGVEPIGAVGEPFDPEVHEAVMHAPSEDVAENNIAHEFQRGYRLGSYVLRPSKVAVSKGVPEPPSEGKPEATE